MGLIDPVIINFGFAANANVSINKCLPAIKNFIDKYRKNDKAIFQLDLAFSHYARATQIAMQNFTIKTHRNLFDKFKKEC